MKFESKRRFHLLCTIVIIGLLAFPAAAFAQDAPVGDIASSSPEPTIQSDKDDYPPGGTVVLTGQNWQPGESVRINVNDDEGQTWNRNVDVTADENGNIRDEFQLPNWFVATYNVTATGTQSGTATTTFTDGSVRIRAAGTGGVPAPISWALYNNTTCSGTPVNSGSINAGISGNGTDVPGGALANQSLRLTAGTVSGATFSNWASGSFTTGAFTPTSNPGCIIGSGSTQNTVVNYQSNQAPTANGQSVTTNEDTSKSITLTGSDADGNNLTFAIVAGQGPTNGSLGTIGPVTCAGTAPKTCSANVTYTPNTNSNGTDTFKFRVNDGTVNSADATVTVNVAAVNDAPTISNITDRTIAEDGDTGDIAFTVSDPDSPVVNLMPSGSSSDTTLVPNANVTFGGSGTNRTVKVTPAANRFGGPATITVTVSDGSGPGSQSATDTFDLTVTPVNDAPSFTKGADQTVDEDSGARTVANWATAISPGPFENQDVEFLVTNDNSGLFAGQPGISPSGTLTYEPAANASGTATVTARAKDDGGAASGGGVDTSSPQTFTIKVDAVNDRPVADDDAYSVDEDETLTVAAPGVLDGDTDVENASLTATVVDGPGHGALTLNNNGSFEYDPNPDYFGPDTFTYRASDGSLDSAPATVSITLDPVNDRPVVSLDGPGTADEGQTKTYTFTVTDVDNANPAVDTDCGADVTPSNVTASGFDCTFPDGPASKTVSVSADDGEASNNMASDTIDVSVRNVAPTVELTGAATADEGPSRAYTYTISDPGDDPNPQVTEECGIGGDHIDTPAPNQFECRFPDGPASPRVKVTANDGDPTDNIGSDSIDVAVANVKPSVVLSGPEEADEGQTKTYAYDVTDPGVDSYTAVESCGANGVKIDTPETSSFQCRFPDGPATTDVTVRVTDSDGAADTDNQLVTVTVANVAPTATFARPSEVNEGGDISLSLNDPVDPGSADTTFEYAFDCGSGYGDFGSASSVDCPTTDDGTRSVGARIRDKDGDSTEYAGTVTINNVAPSVTAPADQTADEGEDKGFDLGTFTDPGADGPWSVTVEWGDGSETTFDAASPGTLGTRQHAYADNGSYTVKVKVAEAGGAPSDEKSFEATVANVAPTVELAAGNPSSADEGQTKTYTYTIGDPGDDTVSTVDTSCGDEGEKVSETNTNTSGSFECRFPDGPASSKVSAAATDSDGDKGAADTQTVQISNVRPTVSLSGPTEVAESVSAERAYAFTVSDPGDDGFEVVAPGYPTCGLNGTLVSGSLDTDAPGYGFECIFPDGDSTSNVEIKVKDTDGAVDTDNQLVTVTISNVAPEATFNAPASVDEGSDINLSLTDATDPAGNNDTIEYRFKCGDADWTAYGSTSTASCPTSDDGSVVVKGQVRDEDGGESPEYEKTVAVNNVAPTANEDNPPAVAEGGSVTLNVLDNDTDPAGANDPLSVTNNSDGAHGAVECQASGSCTYAPNDADFFGIDSFTYTVDDGDGGTDEGTVNVEVTAVNDAPVGKNDAKSTPENTPLVFPASDLTGNDEEGADNEGNQTLTVTEVGEAVNGQVGLSDDGGITFTPDADYNGPASFKYTVCDNGTTNGVPDPKCHVLTAVVNVTISPVNSTPEAADGAEQLDEDAAPISIDLGALVSDKETSDANLTYNIVQGPTPAQGTLTGSGPTFTFDSTKDYFGTFEILYTVTDRGDPDNCSAAPCDTPETSAQKKVTVTVNPVNDAPVAENDSATTDEDNAVSGNVRDNDSDVDNARASLTVTKVGDPARGSVTLAADGSYAYTPNADYHGPDSFTYKVSDGSLDSNVATVNITVRSVNDNPKIDSASGPLSVNEGDTKGYSVSASDVDGDSLAYKWTVVSGPANIPGADNGSNADVKFRDNGAVVLNVTVSDGNGGTDTKTFDIGSANVAPTITNVTSTSQNVLAGTANSLLFTGTATDVSTVDTTAGFGWQWSLNGGTYSVFGAPNANTFKTSFTGCGSQTVSAKAADKDGGVSAPFTTNAVNVYNGAFKAPLTDGTVNKVQKGQVIPVKISVGCGASNLSGLSPHIQLLNGNNSPESETGAIAVTTSVSSADTGQTMRPIDGGYIYNLRVPSDSAATVGKQYTIRVNPYGESANHAATGMYVVIEIRK